MSFTFNMNFNENPSLGESVLNAAPTPSCKPVSGLSIAFPRDAWWWGLKSLLTKGKSNYFLFSAALAAHSHLVDNEPASPDEREEKKKEKKSHLLTLELSLNFTKSCELVNQPWACAGIKHTLTSPEWTQHTNSHRWTVQRLISWPLNFWCSGTGGQTPNISRSKATPWDMDIPYLHPLALLALRVLPHHHPPPHLLQRLRGKFSRIIRTMPERLRRRRNLLDPRCRRRGAWRRARERRCAWGV